MFLFSPALNAFLILALYSVQGQIGQSIKDATAEYDLLTVALSDMENINNGEEFAIMATMRTNKPEGYLFAIVNSRETIIQLGVKVIGFHKTHINVSLVYNDPSSMTPSDSLATFTLPYDPKHWINFALRIMNDRISLYHNCIMIHEINVTKEPKELVFESASTFYLAQAGNSKENFEKKGWEARTIENIHRKRRMKIMHDPSSALPN
ncbi:CLUMA_CG014911, isoform C [Clunio marinus]|uniref:CLUMA_CG014911, isoform C n=1 Tax=Clunio marinus TaxID=568069 RepID=A0A1J1IRI9_9DIPT|nr:CLUMA_CG014911, isoform C [Clunio marinus]